ncbi:Fc.00g059590.m01.CDS01 [Cosmosporella sp. VM-42]
MSWLGVQPLKKFNAPFCTSIAPPETLRCECVPLTSGYSEALLALLRCRYVKCAVPRRSELFDERSLARRCPIDTRMMRWMAIDEDIGLVIAYGVNSAQTAMMASAEWKNDPRNPTAKTGGH